MALLRKLSSSISEVMSVDDTGDLYCSCASGGASGGGASGGASGSASVCASVETSTTSKRPPHFSAEESLSTLGRSTESLLRTMRLDLVLLGSREEEMRSALEQLEVQWEIMKGILGEQRRAEEGEEAERGTLDPEEDTESKKMSTIDWEEESESAMRRATENLYVRKDDPEKAGSSQLGDSNFDWDGADNKELQDEARRASLISCSDDTLKNIIDGKALIEAEEKNGRPILCRLFSTENKKESPKGSINGADQNENPSVERPNPQEKRRPFWSIGGDNGKSKVAEQKSKSADRRSSMGEERPPPFQFFGGKRRNQKNLTGEDGSVNSAASENPFKRMFGRRDTSKDLDRSTNTRETTITQCPSNCSDDASLSRPSSGTNGTSNPASTVSEEEEAHIESLRVKLRGRDSAASSLQQLLSFQTRNLIDLRHEANSLRVSSAFDSQWREGEIERLRGRLRHARVECRRKARLLEGARVKAKKTADREERLKEELESIRTEIIMLNKRMGDEEVAAAVKGKQGQQPRGSRRSRGGEKDWGAVRRGSRGHDRLVLASSGCGDESNEQTERRTGSARRRNTSFREESTPTGVSGGTQHSQAVLKQLKSIVARCGENDIH